VERFDHPGVHKKAGAHVRRPALTPLSMYENLYEPGHIYAERIHRMNTCPPALSPRMTRLPPV